MRSAVKHTGGRRLAAAALATAAAVALALPAPGSARIHGLRTGFTDFSSFQAADPADRAIAFQRARAAGATFVRLTWSWRAMAAGATPANLAETRDPAWPGYRWQFSDGIIRQAVSAGLTPIFEVTQAPPWAEGPGRPPVSGGAPAGTWKPSGAAFEAFAEAVARRYSGRYPDPDNPGATLPRVRYWQGWNEPNLAIYLTPQWTKKKGKFVPASPGIYRALLNGWYRGIKKVSRSNVVLTGGTSPFGDLQPGGSRMPPALFVRELFCLRGRHALRHVHCANSPVRFDVLTHHPYPIGPPRRHAPNPDDVVIADFGRLERPLTRALRAHTVAPRGKKQIWATEFSWESNPPDPGGIPARLEATYMEGAFSELWQEGVSVASWFNLRDDPKGAGYDQTLQSGIYLRAPDIRNDAQKPSYTAFSFPFTAYIHKGRAQLWGLAPAVGGVTIEMQRGSGWKTVARLRARSGDRMFLGHRRLRTGTVLRARQGSRTSLTWTVFSPR